MQECCGRSDLSVADGTHPIVRVFKAITSELVIVECLLDVLHTRHHEGTVLHDRLANGLTSAQHKVEALLASDNLDRLAFTIENKSIRVLKEWKRENE